MALLNELPNRLLECGALWIFNNSVPWVGWNPSRRPSRAAGKRHATSVFSDLPGGGGDSRSCRVRGSWV